MSIPLSPQISLSPSSYSSTGATITAAVSLMNRPAYHGKPAITGLTTITPKIICNRPASGVRPYHVMVSASETTCNAGSAYLDLHYEWDFGDTAGTETLTNRQTGEPVNANNCQVGPEAAYLYRTPGTYTITLTVKGKDENGTLVTASTTSIAVIGMFYPFLGGATGGTYTLTFDGQTTSAIAFDATIDQVVTALRALSILDTGDVRRTEKKCIEICGQYIGQSYTFTANFAGLTGTTGTPQLRAEYSPATYNQITVTDIPGGWTVQHFDSAYDGSNGASNGTESRPYTTFSSLASFITGGSSRHVKIKRGSTFTGTSSLKVDNGNQIRIEPYGTGDDPGFTFDSGSPAYVLNVEVGYGDMLAGDVVLSGITVNRAITTPFAYVYANANGNSTNIYGRIQNVIFDSVTFTRTGAGGENIIQVTDRQNVGSAINSVHVWKTTLDSATSAGQGILATVGHWLSVIGGTIQGGNGNPTLEHHIYPNVDRHHLYSHIQFGLSTNRNYCINLNCRNERIVNEFVLITNCDLTGTQCGIEASNSNNSYGTGVTGHFDNVIVQQCNIHSSQLNPTTNQNGFAAFNLNRVVLRDCNWWDNRQANIVSGDATKPTTFYVYRNRFYDGKFKLKPPQIAEITDNVFHSDDAIGNVSCVEYQTNSLATVTADRNTYYAPSATSPFYDPLLSQYLSFASWQGLGLDPNGSIANPGWATPGSGVFVNAPQAKVDWPAGFTSLGYSLDDGQNWNSYTDNQYISAGSSLAGYQVVHFRANAPGVNGEYQVASYADASSSDTVEESASGTVTGFDLVVYFVLSAGGLTYTFQTAST